MKRDSPKVGLPLHFFRATYLPFHNHSVLRVHDRDGDSVTAVQAVGGAGDSWVVGAHRHLHPV